MSKDYAWTQEDRTPEADWIANEIGAEQLKLFEIVGTHKHHLSYHAVYIWAHDIQEANKIYRLTGGSVKSKRELGRMLPSTDSWGKKPEVMYPWSTSYPYPK